VPHHSSPALRSSILCSNRLRQRLRVLHPCRSRAPEARKSTRVWFGFPRPLAPSVGMRRLSLAGRFFALQYKSSVGAGFSDPAQHQEWQDRKPGARRWSLGSTGPGWARNSLGLPAPCSYGRTSGTGPYPRPQELLEITNGCRRVRSLPLVSMLFRAEIARAAHTASRYGLRQALQRELACSALTHGRSDHYHGAAGPRLPHLLQFYRATGRAFTASRSTECRGCRSQRR
jgi:hypothetical protein